MEQPLTPAVFALLVALTRGRRHGYALIGDVEELTGGHIRLGPGTLYRSLQRMRVDGLIEELPETDDEPLPDRRAERRRSYQITASGIEAARAEAGRLATLVQAARDHGLLNGNRGPDDR